MNRIRYILRLLVTTALMCGMMSLQVPFITSIPTQAASYVDSFRFGGGEFVPPPGMQLWAEARFFEGLVDNDQFSSWADQSGTGAEGISIGTSKPTFQSGQINGHPIVRFANSGTDSGWLEGFCAIDLSARTIYIVYQQTAHVANG